MACLMLFGNMVIDATRSQSVAINADLNACQISALAGVNACLGIANRVLVSSKGLLGNQGPSYKSPEGWRLAHFSSCLFSAVRSSLSANGTRRHEYSFNDPD